jgi:hypothetical protein
MADFSTNIQQFQQNGTYEYEFDDVGNLIFNSSSADFSQVYLSLPLTNVGYNNVKIASFYTPDFEEFIPTTASASPTSSVDDLNNQLSTLQQENQQLQGQLNDMIAQSTTSNPAADSQASKQVILDLRKALGQGRVDSDFSDTFPYTPITKPAPST